MTHCCSITLEIKSKTLNFNQVTLVTALKKWSLYLHWQAERMTLKGKRERARQRKIVRVLQVRQRDTTLILQIACWPVMTESINGESIF